MESFLKLKKDSSESANKNGSYVKQAEHIWTMLDEMASASPDSYKKFIEKTLKEGKESLKPPIAHMCIKGEMIKPNKNNLYANIFSWNKIPNSKTDEDPIPIYGIPLEQVDKNTSVVNLAFNNVILDKYGKNAANKLEQDMLINLILNYIESQNKIELNRKAFKVFEETTCYGDVNKWILKLADKDGSKLPDKEFFDSISQLDGKNIPESVINKISNINLENKSSEVKPSQTLIQELDEKNVPQFEEKFVEASENRIAYYEYKIDLLKLSSANEFQLEIEDDYLLLTANEKFYKPLKISLDQVRSKYKIQMDNIEAKFVKKYSYLRIKLPIIFD